MKFETISIKDGLSQSSVLVVFQDSRGYMWFGTQDGLNRFDGYNFKVYKNNTEDSTTISDNWIYSISEDDSGNLWIGTSSGGLNMFDRNTETFIRLRADQSDKNSISSDIVLTTFIDSENILWIGTADSGLNKYDLNTGRFQVYKTDQKNPGSISGNSIVAITEDSNGDLWIGTAENGLNKFDKSTNQFTRYKCESGKNNSICNNKITQLYFNQAGLLWIGTENGLSSYDIAQDKFINFSESSGLKNTFIKAIYQDNKNNLWVGTNGGIHVRSPGRKRFVAYQHDVSNLQSISENIIQSIYEDKSGIIWIGTHGGGLNKCDPKKNSFMHYKQNPVNPNSLIDNNVWSFAEDKSGLIWIGTNNGICSYNPQTERFRQYYPQPGVPGKLSHKVIRAIVQDHKRNLWCGTDGGGVDMMIYGTNRFINYKHDPADTSSLSDNKIRAIFQDSKNNLWFATWNGLDRFDFKQKRFEHFKHDPQDSTSISDNRVRSLYEDSKGNLWVGTYGGLNLFNRETKQFKRYIRDENDEFSLSNNRVLCIHEDASGRIWVGTFHGLNKLEPNQKSFKRYHVKDGLPNDVIYGIVEDEFNNLWFSTNNGLAMHDPNRSQLEPFRKFDVHDGLQSNEFNGGSYLKCQSGDIYFGGINGFNRFSPQNVEKNKYIPPVVLTAFKKFDKEIKLDQSVTETDQINLTYKDNFFSFEFAALDYTNPEKNQYIYKLEGFDENWIECGYRTYASYTNLDGGEYVFKVKGSNNDGVWNDEGASVKIIITPPYWKTWWFRILAGFLILAGVFSYSYSQINRVRRQRETLRKEVAKRTKELAQSNTNLQRAQYETQRMATQTSLLYETGMRISKELDLDIVFDKIVTLARDAFDYYSVMLFLYEKERNGLLLKSIAGGYVDVFPSDLFVENGKGMTGQASLTKKTQLSNDVSKNPNFFRGADEVTQSELCVPIISNDEVIGVLDMQSNELNSFSDYDVEVAETFCLQIASAIKNAHLYDHAQNEIAERKRAEDQLRESKDNLEAAQEETNNILNNVEEGLFLLDKDGKIGTQYSKSLERLFEEKDLAHKKIISLVQDRIPEKALKSFDEYLELMFKDDVDEEILIPLNPVNEIELNMISKDGIWKDSKFLMFKFKRIMGGNGQISELIATVKDITDQKRLSKQLEQSEADQKKQIEWMMSILHVEPILLKEFIESSKNELEYIADLLKSKGKIDYNIILQNVYRSMHLIKGNASLLDLQFFENKAHIFEDDIIKLQQLSTIRGSDFVTLVIQLQEMRKMMGEIDNLIERLGNIHKQFRPKREYENKLFIKSLNNLVKNLSKDYDKKVNFNYDDFNIEQIPFEFRLTIKEVLIQLIKNAIYHGLEAPPERSAKNKSKEGLLKISCELQNGALFLNLRDDGRGIQLDKVKKKAELLNRWDDKEIASWDEKQIVNLIFEPGISTSDSSDFTAGRGVGMDAIKARIAKLKGEINVNFAEDKFCEFNIKIPLKTRIKKK